MATDSTNMATAWSARSPFNGLAGAPGGGDVIVTERSELGIALILARRGQRATLEQCWHARFQGELPRGPQRVETGGISIAGTGPASWLATQENGGNEFAASLEIHLAGCASVIDQTDGYAVLRLTGRGVRATLAKLVPLDIHARAFPVGAVAGTVAAHIGVTLWRLADAHDGAPVFEIAVYRSMALSLWQAVAASAAWHDPPASR